MDHEETITDKRMKIEGGGEETGDDGGDGTTTIVTGGTGRPTTPGALLGGGTRPTTPFLPVSNTRTSLSASRLGGGGGGGRHTASHHGGFPITSGPLTSAVGANGTNTKTAFDPSRYPPFPEPGSVLGPDGRYFCLGRLGRGTFCSIHRCVDLAYFHHTLDDHDLPFHAPNGGLKQTKSKRTKARQRIVAAKAELSTFANSGVLDGEASVLRHLYSVMPDNMVPVFLDYVRQSPSSSSGGGGGGGIAGNTPGTTTVSTTTGAAAACGGVGGGLSAIIMEYLLGEDMHQLRERHCQLVAASRQQQQQQRSSLSPSQSQPVQQQQQQQQQTLRRLSTPDAVYLTSEIMLPLLQAMHNAGVIHRDVKPSNCVRAGTTDLDKTFRIVDFGLSKSFVVPKNSSFADERYVWTKPWQVPPLPTMISSSSFGQGQGQGGTGKYEHQSEQPTRGCLRKERPDADFRGTSMYASLRVHQGRDYCRRDDMWSLLYVFCDLVSGGLPWMSYAANRDRTMCCVLKEIVHGERCADDLSPEKKRGGVPNMEGENKMEDQIELLLYGAEYHVAKYRRENILRASRENPMSEVSKEAEARLPPLPEPLKMSRDTGKVQLLRRAFQHVQHLGFADEPDYELIRTCLRGFMHDDDDDDKVKREEDYGDDDEFVPNIDWNNSPDERKKTSGGGSSSSGRRIKQEEEEKDPTTPIYEILDELDPLTDAMLADAEWERQTASSAGGADGVMGGEGGGGGMSGQGGSLDGTGATMTAEAADIARLPLSLQFRLAQVEYNARHSSIIPKHLALRDWMALAIPLVYNKWDTARYERGNHRTDNDGYRKEVFYKLVRRCLECAKMIDGRFPHWSMFVMNDESNDDDDLKGETKKIKLEEEDGKTVKIEEGVEVKLCNKSRKRMRKLANIVTSSSELEKLLSSSSLGRLDTMNNSAKACLTVSKVHHGLTYACELEEDKKFAPPPAISFGSGGGE